MIQSIIDTLYRHPTSALKKFQRFGGYRNYNRIIKGRKLMGKAYLSLPPVPSYADGLPIYFLTGNKYLYQTLFCIGSLSKVSNKKFRFILVDDGTFTPNDLQQINNQLPNATIIGQQTINKNLATHLPKNLYPYLHQKRKEYPHIKKLTDIHTIADGDWKLVLDSDMLFWEEPETMIQWLTKPNGPLYMLDCQESYGYSKPLMKKLCGADIQPLINVGTIGLNSKAINWASLEFWAQKLEEREGTSYYLEQALTAMIIGEKECTILSDETYIVGPSENDVKKTKGILHHYVDLSKESYFKYAWHKVTDR